MSTETNPTPDDSVSADAEESRQPVSTRVSITLDYGEPEMDAADAGIGLGGTAADVVAAMRADVGKYGGRRDLVRDWDLDDDPDIRVEVYTRFASGPPERTTAEWSMWTDIQEREAASAATPGTRP